VSWGHDWVTLCLVVQNPWRAPSKVFALPICMRLYRNRQGLTKGKKKDKGKTKKKTPLAKHRTRPEMLQLVAGWFPERRFLFLGGSLYTGQSVLQYLPDNVHMIGQVHPQGALYEPPK
jgi:hypothetical protein